MATITNVKTNKYGQAILTSDNLRELILQGKNISHLNVVFDDDIELFKKYQADLLYDTVTFLESPEEKLSFDEFHKQRADEWIFPIIYQQLDVREWLLSRCKTKQEVDRVNIEYIMYEERDLIMLLRLFIYLISYMRENRFVWGVGRGSSTSSYVLYLIGTHFVNSLKYNLDIKDFLK